jgi:hypothetical protein
LICRSYLPGRWGPDRRRLGPRQTGVFLTYIKMLIRNRRQGPGPMLFHT